MLREKSSFYLSQVLILKTITKSKLEIIVTNNTKDTNVICYILRTQEAKITDII